MKRPLAWRVGTIAGLAFLLAGAAEPEAQPAPEPEGVTLPVTIEKISFKSPRHRKSGDLIVSEEGLEFIFGKRNLMFSMDEVYILSYGKLRGDLDTEWALVALGDDGPAEVIGIRDGKRLGYGQRTEEIYQLLLRAFEQVGAGQYDVPQGYRPYDVLTHHGALAIPETWHAYADRLIVDSEGQTWGTIVFSADALAPPSSGADKLSPLVEDPKLHRIMAGELPAFFWSLQPAGANMTCDEIAPKAVEHWIASGEYDPLARMGYTVEQAPETAPARVAFCNGLRVRATSRRPDGKRVLVEVHAAANRETLFVLGFHALEGSEADWREAFATALETLRLSASQ